MATKRRRRARAAFRAHETRAAATSIQGDLLKRSRKVTMLQLKRRAQLKLLQRLDDSIKLALAELRASADAAVNENRDNAGALPGSA
jgi:hypothetical protein